MHCQRCMADTHVETHTVNGYTGYLCDRCRGVWEDLAATPG